MWIWGFEKVLLHRNAAAPAFVVLPFTIFLFLKCAFEKDSGKARQRYKLR
jgi:hypothetical protein